MKNIDYDKFAVDYDMLYSSKNYLFETEFLLKKLKHCFKVLDVGCGTGIHSYHLSKNNKQMVGIDISAEMIAMAKINNKNQPSLFFHETIENHSLNNLSEYDAVISMFNVVNHLKSLKQLISFFNSCYKILKKDGIMIFDCWNSVACTIEKPYENQEKHLNDKIIKYETKTDLIDSTSETKILFDEKEFVLTTHMWSPRILKEISKYTGFVVQEVLNFRNVDLPATEKDHRILFVIKKK